VFLRNPDTYLQLHTASQNTTTKRPHLLENLLVQFLLQYTDHEMIPARNARNVVTLEVVMFVTIQRENILPSKITDY
jgi:hypothetical protein